PARRYRGSRSSRPPARSGSRRRARIFSDGQQRPSNSRGILFRKTGRPDAAARQSRLDGIRPAGAGDVAAIPERRARLLHRRADLKPKIKVAFASGPDDLNRELIDRMAALFPELPLYVVSEFPPHAGRWIPY